MSALLNGSNRSSTASLLFAQWTNPNDVLSVLLIIGGDIIRTALAQTSGGAFTPVCFSFGWVAYSLTALIGVVGDGRLLPDPDYPAKVFNLKNGYVRENKSWVIGRLLRDNEIHMSRAHPLRGRALRISIYEAQPRKSGPEVAGSGLVRLISIIVILSQLIIAAIPFILYGEWGFLMVTGVGTLLALSAGALPQWRAEKLPNKRHSNKNFAITSGNGSRDIMVVLGNGNGLDLEELANSESPRSTRRWEAVNILSRAVTIDDGMMHHGNSKVEARRAFVHRGIPIGYWITTFMCAVQCFLWLYLLIVVAGLRSHTWYLLIVGGLGMVQNATIAGVSRDPEKRCLPLRLVDTIITMEVMDGLMDLEFTYGELGNPFAQHLVKEFFPGALDPAEEAWWKRNRKEYDDTRHMEADRRGPPRSRIGKLQNLSSSRSSFSEIDLSRKKYRSSGRFGSHNVIGWESDIQEEGPTISQLAISNISQATKEQDGRRLSEKSGSSSHPELGQKNRSPTFRLPEPFNPVSIRIDDAPKWPVTVRENSERTINNDFGGSEIADISHQFTPGQLTRRKTDETDESYTIGSTPDWT